MKQSLLHVIWPDSKELEIQSPSNDHLRLQYVLMKNELHTAVLSSSDAETSIASRANVETGRLCFIKRLRKLYLQFNYKSLPLHHQ